MNNFTSLPRLTGWHNNLLIYREVKKGFWINNKLVAGRYNLKLGNYVFCYLPVMAESLNEWKYYES